jgi:hypothetical protein
MKAILAIVAVLVAAVAIYVARQYMAIQQAVSGPAKELVSEKMERKGDTWYVDFVTKFDAPIDRVYEAFSRPERVIEFAPENVLKSDLVKSDGNVKTVNLVARLDILPPGFKVQNIQFEYTLNPETKTITTKTIDFKLADMASEFKFEPGPEGNTTVLKFHQTSKDKAPMLVESLQKGALREQYLITVRAVNRSLGLAPVPQKAQAG